MSNNQHNTYFPLHLGCTRQQILNLEKNIKSIERAANNYALLNEVGMFNFALLLQILLFLSLFPPFYQFFWSGLCMTSANVKYFALYLIIIPYLKTNPLVWLIEILCPVNFRRLCGDLSCLCATGAYNLQCSSIRRLLAKYSIFAFLLYSQLSSGYVRKSISIVQYHCWRLSNIPQHILQHLIASLVAGCWLDRCGF